MWHLGEQEIYRSLDIGLEQYQACHTVIYFALTTNGSSAPKRSCELSSATTSLTLVYISDPVARVLNVLQLLRTSLIPRYLTMLVLVAVRSNLVLYRQEILLKRANHQVTNAPIHTGTKLIITMPAIERYMSHKETARFIPTGTKRKSLCRPLRAALVPRLCTAHGLFARQSLDDACVRTPCRYQSPPSGYQSRLQSFFTYQVEVVVVTG